MESYNQQDAKLQGYYKRAEKIAELVKSALGEDLTDSVSIEQMYWWKAPGSPADKPWKDFMKSLTSTQKIYIRSAIGAVYRRHPELTTLGELIELPEEKFNKLRIGAVYRFFLDRAFRERKLIVDET